MPAIFVPIAVFLASIIGPLISRALLSLGMGIIVYQGVQAGIDELRGYVNDSWAGIASDAASVAAMCGFDTFITLIISAYSSLLSFKLVSGAIKKIGFMPDQGG